MICAQTILDDYNTKIMIIYNLLAWEQFETFKHSPLDKTYSSTTRCCYYTHCHNQSLIT